MHLDAFWHAKTGTVNKHRLLQGLEQLATVGIPPLYPKLGPHSLEDTYGYTIAIQMLEKSRKQGKRGRAYQQFNTIRQLRAGYSSVYKISAQGVEEGASYGQGQNHSVFTHCPTETVWFLSFVSGCKKRMGKELDANVALLGEGVRESLKEIMFMACQEPDWRVKEHLLCVGAYIVITYVASLRGEETFCMDLGAVRKYLPEGRRHPTHLHVVVALQGCFKVETGERCHLIPLPMRTRTGIEVGHWMDILVRIRQAEGRMEGPAFCDARGDVARQSEYNTTSIEVLEQVQQRRPDIFTGEVVSDTHGISQSLRKGLNTEAQVAGINEAEVNHMNQWRKVEWAKGRRPKFNMMEHYMSVKINVKALLRYPSSL